MREEQKAHKLIQKRISTHPNLGFFPTVPTVSQLATVLLLQSTILILTCAKWFDKFLCIERREINEPRGKKGGHGNDWLSQEMEGYFVGLSYLLWSWLVIFLASFLGSLIIMSMSRCICLIVFVCSIKGWSDVRRQHSRVFLAFFYLWSVVLSIYFLSISFAETLIYRNAE